MTHKPRRRSTMLVASSLLSLSSLTWAGSTTMVTQNGAQLPPSLSQQAACEALHALAAVRPASASQLPTAPWPQAWKALVKPALWPADVLPQMGDEEANHAPGKKAMRSLKQAHGTKPWRLETGKHTPEGVLVLKGAGATIHLQALALARGDFNGDG